MYLRIFVIIALICLSTCNCPINNEIQNLVADTVNFMNPQLSGQSVIYTFKNSFIAIPKVAIAIQHFDIKSGNSGNFSVSAFMIRSNDITFRFFRAPDIWNKLRMNFFATIRGDLVIGAGYSQYPSGLFGTSAVSIVNFQNQIPFFSRSIIRVFLNGFTYKGSVIDIQIVGRKLEAKQLSVNIEAQNDFALYQIYYSYFIFAPGNVNFSSYGGLISLNNFEGLYYEDAHRIIYNSNYQLYGLNKITLSGNKAIQFASIIDESQVAGVYSSQKFEQLNLIYIILGVSPSNSCSKCSNKIYAFGNMCLQTCPLQTYGFQYNDKGSACRGCSQKLNQILSNGKCVCNSNSEADKDGKCILTRGTLYNFVQYLNYANSWQNPSNQPGGNVVISTNTQNPSNSNPTTTTGTLTASNSNSNSNSISNMNMNNNLNTNNVNTISNTNTNSNSNANTITNVNVNINTNTNTNPNTVTNTNSPTNIINIIDNTNINSNTPINTVAISDGSCSSPNQFWTGFRCACKVGYQNKSNQCVPLLLQKSKGWISRQPAADLYEQNVNSNNGVKNDTPVVQHQCYMIYEYFNGQGCMCIENYMRVNGVCTLKGDVVQECQKQENRMWVNNSCVCKTGFIWVNQICLRSGNDCPPNSYNNGLGSCICSLGFYNDTVTKSCVKGTPCPPNSLRNANGVCICNQGLNMYEGYCAKCPLGAVWDNVNMKCMFVCGQKSRYNQILKQCQCETGFGLYNKLCTICPANFFLKDNYCVQCPLNSNFNSNFSRCVCNDGYFMNTQGFCIAVCKNNQRFFNGSCKCNIGLGRVLDVCQICPSGTYPSPTTQKCEACTGNYQPGQGKCICKKGFQLDKFGVCLSCQSLPNSYLMNGNCAVCAGDMIYDLQAKKCGCPSGKIKIGIRCIDPCKNDELLDQNNNCYSCPINQYIDSVSQTCTCLKGYVRNNQNGRCQLVCNQKQFIYQNKCAQCPLNLQFRTQINGCACPNGYYVGTNSVCEKLVLSPITCEEGFFFSPEVGCRKCSLGCSKCTGLNACQICSQKGYRPINGICSSVCGDGIIVGSQQCDDGNTNSTDGCASVCFVQPLYTCSGQPSICNYTGPSVCGNGRIQGSQECDDGNTVNGDGCSNRCFKQSIFFNNTNINLTVVGQVRTNINNVFVVLKTPKKYTFANQVEMQNFMKAQFPGSFSIPSVYCAQRQAPDLDTFECLAIYSSGIPNRKFNIVFSYNYKGDVGRLNIEVNPLNSVVTTRSIQNNNRK